MLKNTAFHDNLYQLAKIVSITTEGLSLELSENMFLDKMLADISFVSDTLQTLFGEVQNLSHLPEYLPIMQSLYSCETDYLLLLKAFAAKTIEKQITLPVSGTDLSAYYKLHSDVKDRIEKRIQESDKNLDAYQIVSQNELSQLLCI
ncbi:MULTISPECIES: hypothetical protein [unclassified Treponema]|uniref:hypothetical protein n=1 Tax=unclassified Treponema TaxID=2638727 RepID=UPI0005301334|nr:MULTISPECIES: hypothetical protein [unclassified Treponema]AIW88608.1 hypothetical protein JO41_01375 [Treponema sp. OMZ 838]UTC44196.1 hypothetical protein E4N66_09025 [Treponema sp. OMZ 857]UTC51385.1 hypothetical protein E4N65_03325 [Treponema sp. OMZ 855]